MDNDNGVLELARLIIALQTTSLADWFEWDDDEDYETFGYGIKSTPTPPVSPNVKMLAANILAMMENLPHVERVEMGEAVEWGDQIIQMPDSVEVFDFSVMRVNMTNEVLESEFAHFIWTQDAERALRAFMRVADLSQDIKQKVYSILDSNNCYS